MSGVGQVWLAHTAAAALGLALAGLVLRASIASFARRPVLAYRLAGAVLVGALLLPLVQAAAARLELGGVLRELLVRAPAAPSEPEHATHGAPGVPGVPGARRAPPREAASSEAGPLPLFLLGAWFAAEPNAAGPANAITEDGPSPASEAGIGIGARLAPAWAGLALLHAAGALACLARSLRRLARTRGVLRRARRVTAREAPELVRLWRALAARSPLGSRIALRASDELESPVCFGGRHPAILLPARDVVGPGDLARLRCVLLHELVHLERRDSRSMLVQELLRAFFWFHPVAWWLERELDHLREVSCDWIAVRRAGSDRGGIRRYASTLLDYAVHAGSAHHAHGAALVGRPSSSSQLRRRIDMLIAFEARPERRAPRALFSLAVLALGAAWTAQTAAASVWAPQGASAGETRLALEPLGGASMHLAGVQRSGAREPLRSGAREPLAEPGSEPGRTALEQLAALGYAETPEAPALGIRLEPVGEALAAHLGRDRKHLMVITGVVAGSLAERAGLQRLDVLFEVDGEPLTSDALARAKQGLGAGRSLALGLIRRGAMQRQQIGPFQRDVLEQSRAALRKAQAEPALDPLSELGQRGLKQALALQKAKVEYAAGSPAGAAELQRLALEYYARVDDARFKNDLAEALKVYRDLARDGELNEETQQHRAFVEDLLRSDRTHEYLERTRATLGGMTPEQFEKEVGGSLSKLDPAVRRGILERWSALDSRSNQPRGFFGPQSGAWRTPGAAGGAGGAPEDVAAALKKAKAELQRQAQELDRLRQRLDELERSSGDR